MDARHALIIEAAGLALADAGALYRDWPTEVAIELVEMAQKAVDVATRNPNAAAALISEVSWMVDDVRDAYTTGNFA